MDFSLYYGENYDKRLEKRYDELYNRFLNGENKKPEYVFSSPGRAEILGNHTDHNHGKVMVAAINCDILCFASPIDGDKIHVFSDGYPVIEVNLNDLSENDEEHGTSLALVKGVCKGIKDRGFSFGGFVAYMESEIFKGAGVSSSAAFEVLICEILNVMYLGGKLSAVEKAVISQYSENVYFGKPCGLLDQSGIAIGSLSKLDFFVPEQPEILKLKAPAGYTLVITNTGGDHAKLTPHYAAIREEMQAVASYFNKKVLRDVEYGEFLDSIKNLKTEFSSRAIMRAMHFYSENARVEAAEKALNAGDTQAFLREVASSGESSLCVLQNCYVPGSVDQPVALAIEYSKRITENSVFRVHGGGFAGSILGFVENGELNNYVSKMGEVFGANNVFKAIVRPIGTAGEKL